MGDVHVLAIDHRWQVEAMADAAGAPRKRLRRAKWLLHIAALRAADVRSGVGLLVDDQYGADVIEARRGDGGWLARAVDEPRSRPVQFCAEPIADVLASWPHTHIAKLMVYAHPDDPEEIADPQWRRMTDFIAASAATGRAVLVEFQAPSPMVADGTYLRAMLSAAYERGIAPRWWKLPPVADASAWNDVAAMVAAADPTCEGIVVLGQDAGAAAVEAALATAAGQPLVRGFAVGRAIFAASLQRWLRNDLADEGLIDDVCQRFVAMVDAWQRARCRAGGAT
jgi:5-dehydro-2-deoxygluconokinase